MFLESLFLQSEKPYLLATETQVEAIPLKVMNDGSETRLQKAQLS